MAKKNKNAGRVEAPGTRPLFVVCGLPTSVETATENTIKEAFDAPCEVVSTPTGSADSAIFSEKYIRQVISSMITFTQRRRKHQSEASPTPAKIVLFYVPTSDSEALLRKLDFSVFPIPLRVLAEWDSKGKLYRNDRSATKKSLCDAVAEFESHHEFFNRLQLRRTGDAIFLPPKNFEVRKGQPIGELFLELRNGTRQLTDRFPEAKTQDYKPGDLPKLKEPRRFFKDAREIVFVDPHPSAYHGSNRTTGEPSLNDQILLLQSLYRFGASIPEGFQHDAQLEGGKAFKDQLFNCSVAGYITVSDHHADIYADDFVRHRTKK